MNILFMYLTFYITALCTPEALARLSYVNIKNGTLKGRTTKAAFHGGTIYSYTRIPYAKAPVGPLRFKSPEPADGWGSKTWDALFPSMPCPQPSLGIGMMEDCLFLNVYTKRAGRRKFAHFFGDLTVQKNTTADEELLPVIVYLYGGDFVMGDNMYYNGHKLLSQDLVLVVPNYRIGILGFLSTGDEASPGNYGLKDQSMALRWVQENIAAFGGDPSRVTLMGESAGGAAVSFHLLSPLSRGLFQKVIIQSGSPISPWTQHDKPFEAAQRIAGMLHCPNSTSSEMMTCLREASVTSISEVAYKLITETIKSFEMAVPGLTPVVEPDVPGAFIKKDPYELLQHGEIPDVPIIIGSCLTEGSLMLSVFYYFNLASDPSLLEDPVFVSEKLVPKLFTHRNLDDYILQETMIARDYLLPGTRGSLKTWEETMPELVDMMGVFFNKGSILHTANILSRRLKSPVYLYSFEQSSQNSIYHLLWPFVTMFFGGTIPPVDHGVMHADDVMYAIIPFVKYLFPIPMIPTSSDTEFSKMFIKIWTDFVHTGNPTPESTNSSYVSWPRYNATNRLFYRLKLQTPKVSQDYRKTFRRPYV